jgi:hypothetical protein
LLTAPDLTRAFTESRSSADRAAFPSVDAEARLSSRRGFSIPPAASDDQPCPHETASAVVAGPRLGPPGRVLSGRSYDG